MICGVVLCDKQNDAVRAWKVPRKTWCCCCRRRFFLLCGFMNLEVSGAMSVESKYLRAKFEDIPEFACSIELMPTQFGIHKSSDSRFCSGVAYICERWERH